MKVGDLMHREVITAKPSDQVTSIVAAMYRAGIGSVVVVDDRGTPIGIFTERDLVRVIAEGIPLSIPVERVMTTRVITASIDESLNTAAHKMLDHGIRHLPVVDNSGKLVGIISIRDVVKALITDSQFP